jgi:hypothetical protein
LLELDQERRPKLGAIAVMLAPELRQLLPHGQGVEEGRWQALIHESNGLFA